MNRCEMCGKPARFLVWVASQPPAKLCEQHKSEVVEAYEGYSKTVIELQ